MAMVLELDEALVAGAMRLTGMASQKAAVEEGLRRLIHAAEQRRALEDIRGLGWEGDLDALRASRV